MTLPANKTSEFLGQEYMCPEASVPPEDIRPLPGGLRLPGVTMDERF